MEDLSTKEKLRLVGKNEFLEKGYKDASLREIAKKSGFTLGAFYGYYASKEELFEDIVGAAAEGLYSKHIGEQEAFEALPKDRQAAAMNEFSRDGLILMINYIYQDIDIFKLLFLRSAGTRHENYMQRLIDVEIDSTKTFIETLNKQGRALQIEDEIIHILSSAMFSGMMEVVDHDMSKEKAIRYMTQLRDFYYAGWQHMLGL